MKDSPEFTSIPLLQDDPLSKATSINPDDNEWQYQQESCRICLEEDRVENLFAPCRCSGSSQYVHVDCLNEWRATSNNPEAFNRCFTCNYSYKTKVSQQELGCCGKFNFGQPKYYCGFYMINFIFIFILGLILQLLDPHQYIPNFFDKYLDPYQIIPNHQQRSMTTMPTNQPTKLSTSSMFDYYALASYIYLVLIFLVFGIALLRAKNRKLYLQYLLGGPWYIAILRLVCIFGLTALCLTTSTMIGCFVMTCLIQAMVRHHYNYLNHLYRASESIILPYDPVGDHHRGEEQV